MELTIMASAPVPPLPPWPDDGLDYTALPASGDDGFPQAFLIEIDGTIYRLTLAVYYRDPACVLDATQASSVFELPDPSRGLFLNLKVEYENRPEATRPRGRAQRRARHADGVRPAALPLHAHPRGAGKPAKVRGRSARNWWHTWR